MEIIRDGTDYRCPNCGYRKEDYDIPDENWAASSNAGCFRYFPLCPDCQEELVDTTIWGD